MEKNEASRELAVSRFIDLYKRDQELSQNEAAHKPSHPDFNTVNDESRKITEEIVSILRGGLIMDTDVKQITNGKYKSAAKMKEAYWE